MAEQIYHFVPNRMVLLLNHAGEPDDNTLRDQVHGELSRLTNTSAAAKSSSTVAPLLESLKDALNPATPGSNLRRVSTFRGKQRQRSLMELVVDAGPADLKAMLDDLNDRIQADAGGGTMQIMVASPDWLCGAAQGHVITGGPGGKPRPYSGDVTQVPYKFALPALDVKVASTGKAVEVAVLDTAPTRDALHSALGRWPQHPILSNFFNAQGQPRDAAMFNITYAAPDDLPALPDGHHLEIQSHQYPMPDHGLFAAGIVRTIAAGARIRLIEVLNRYGVGSLSSIAAGLRQLAGRDETVPLMINCSWVLAIPREGHRTDALAWPKLASDAGLVQRFGWTVEHIFDAFMRRATAAGTQVLAVAAAGNEAANGVRPAARFPAACPNVVGVGAMADDQATIADYSNLADAPTPTGLMTFGGQQTDGIANATTGMLGVYTGEFPADGTGRAAANQNGWGWWAGTSFASPIISGTLAHLVGSGVAPSAAVDAVRNVPAATSSQGEELFPVRQKG